MATAGRIFVSYASPTVERARLVADTLRTADYDVWIDDQLLAHRPFADSIEEALTAADAVVVLWSEQAVRSDWVRSEANRAREAGKLVQLRLDGCRLPMPFDQIHCIDLANWAGESEPACWQSTLTSLSATIAARRPSVPTAARSPSSPASASRGGLERRRITALACAIANWRDLAAQDPEDQLIIAEAFHAALGTAIGDHDGVVVERTGNTALALFGRLQASEEDGANAVRAALALCAARDVDISCGIATGLVVVKGDADGAAAVIGDAPAAARALVRAAAPRTVLVADATRRVSEGMFTFSNAPPVAREGAIAPLAAFEVVKALAVASRSQARAARYRHGVFGREAELRLLRDGWDAAEDGMGQITLLIGEAGIGKSTLLAAFRSELPDAGVQLTLHCGPAHTASALHPIEMALRQAAAIDPADQPAIRRAKLERYAADVGLGEAGAIEQLVTLVGGSPAAVAVEPTPERRRRLLFEQLLKWFEVLTVPGPALFVVEDLHWADPTTLELLELALAAVPERRWMIVGTARPDFTCDWAAHCDLQVLDLNPIGTEEACQICHQFDIEGRLSAADRDSIIKRSDGNPLFVEEMTRFALAKTASAKPGGTPIAIPDTLQDLLVARMDRLGEARTLVRTAAALGRQFGYDLVAAATHGVMAPTELRAGLRELVREGLIDSVGTPPRSSYMFRHALFVDAAYESIPKREREALHARIATALRSGADGATAPDPAILAHHLTRGGQPAEAIPLWAMAGAAAAAKAAHVEAADSFKVALGLLRATPREAAGIATELQLLLGLAVSLAAVLGFSADEVGEVLGEARAICDATGNDESLFVVLRNLYSFVLVRGELDASEEIARPCFEIAERTGLATHRIEGCYCVGYVLWAKGDLSRGPALLNELISVYEQHDGASLPRLAPMDPSAGACGPLGLAALARGDMASLDVAARRLDHSIEQSPDGFTKAFSAFWRSTLIVPGEYDPYCRRVAEHGLALARDSGYALVERQLATSLGRLVGGSGDPAAGLALAEPAVMASLAAGVRHGMPWGLYELAWLHGLAGDIDRGLAVIDQSIALAETTGEIYWYAPQLLRRSQLLVLSGDADAAEETRQRAHAFATEQGANGFLQWIDAAAPSKVAIA